MGYPESAEESKVCVICAVGKISENLRFPAYLKKKQNKINFKTKNQPSLIRFSITRLRDNE